jgi:hypothetical protein
MVVGWVKKGIIFVGAIVSDMAKRWIPEKPVKATKNWIPQQEWKKGVRLGKVLEDGTVVARGIGAVKKWEPRELMEEWGDYLEECRGATIEHPTAKGEIVVVRRPRVPTLGGFWLRLSIGADTWGHYKSGKNYGSYHGIVKMIDGYILAAKLDALVNGEGSTTGLIFDLKANYGINERNIIDQTVNGSMTIDFRFE